MKSTFSSINQGFSVSTLAIRRHIGTMMLTLAVIVVGIFMITSIPVDLLPSITYPRIGVRLETGGIAPEIAIEEITRPLEEVFTATEGVELIYSQTRENSVSLDLYFRVGEDIGRALNDATASLNRARQNLPNNIDNPTLFKFEPSQSPIYEFGLTSDSREILDLRILAEEELARELNVIPGVASVDVSGGVEEEVRIQINLDRTKALGVGLQDVLNKLDESNQDITGGRLIGQENEPLTRVVGRLKSAEELNNISFAIPNSSRRVYLREFAEILDGGENQRIFVYLNGTPAVKVSIRKQPDANTIEVVKRIKEKIAELQGGNLIPEDLTILPTLDESILINNSINNVINAGLSGSILAGIAVLLFLGSLRQTFIIVISIPLATLTAIIIMKICGLSLNIFSLGGLALGVGIVVDNSIVMLENIVEGVETANNQEDKSHSNNNTRKWQKKRIIEQSISSSKQVESALIASTSTNLVSVLPFLMIGGFISLLFRELVLTISFAVAASIVVALTIVPMLASRLLAIPYSSQIKHFFLIKWFNLGFNAANRGYVWLLGKLIKVRWIFVLFIFIFLSVNSWQAVQQLSQEILPKINTGQVFVWARFPVGTTLETNHQVMQLVDEVVRKQPETEYAFTTSGGFLFSNTTSENVLRGSINITLKQGVDAKAYVSKLDQELQKLNLVDIRLNISLGEVRGLFINNSPVRNADLDIILQGNDQKILEQTGEKITDILTNEAKLVRFTADADARQTEVIIRPNLARLADLNLNLADIEKSLQTAVSGLVATNLQRDERLIPIRVQLDPTMITDSSSLLTIPLFSRDNRLIRLGDVATLETGKAPAIIQRINQRQVYIIAGNLAENAQLSSALAEIKQVLETVELPKGVRILPSNTAQTNKEIQSNLVILSALAVFLVFVVMAVQYNSLIDPLVIMSVMPLALSGGIYGLYYTETPVGATVIVGAVLLVGIVVNNAIVMVELANEIYQNQKNNPEIVKASRASAMIEAAGQRLRPILMTTITTVLGMYPLAVGAGEGGKLLQPLGIVVFWGLSLATLLTLFVIPCIHVMFHQPLNFAFRGEDVVSSVKEKDNLPSEDEKIATKAKISL